MTLNNDLNYKISEYQTVVGNSNNNIVGINPSASSGIPLISQGSSSNPTFGTVSVAGGGTGSTSFTEYAVICGGTTSTNPFQSISGVGTAGQLLTSNGAASLPTFQNAPASTSGYALNLSTDNFIFPELTTVFLAQNRAAAYLTSGNVATRIYIPTNGTINSVYGLFIYTTDGSNNNFSIYLRLNNTTDTLIATLASTAVRVPFSGTSLGVSVTAGDYIEFKLETPDFGGQPNAGFSITAFIT